MRRCLLYALLLALALALPGCTRRFRLSKAELAKVEELEGGVTGLYVYPHRRFVAVYDEQEVKQSYDVRGKIRDKAKFEPLYEIITRNTAGSIIKFGELNGVPALWVAFDRECERPACAYVFVYSFTDRYLLARVPLRAEYKPPKTHRGAVIKACRMRPHRIESLGEYNDVYAVKRKLLKPLMLHLQVKKYVWKPKRPRRHRATGRDGGEP